MNNLCLFLGGSHDGIRHEIFPGLDRFEVAVPRAVPLSSFSFSEVPETECLRTETYHRVRLFEDRCVFTFGHPWTVREIFDRLVDVYNVGGRLIE